MTVFLKFNFQLNDLYIVRVPFYIMSPHIIEDIMNECFNLGEPQSSRENNFGEKLTKNIHQNTGASLLCPAVTYVYPCRLPLLTFPTPRCYIMLPPVYISGGNAGRLRVSVSVPARNSVS